MTREANRARFPEFAAIVDACDGHAKLVFAKDAQGSLGKRPEPECEIENFPKPYVQPKGSWDRNGVWK